nr:TetR/AcrR family transcriptional regulator [Phytoactinopolyspora alkaliphila]
MAEHAKDVAPDTASRIREVALELFTRQGYEKTSLREIAAALGITKAAVYYHYRSKVDILDDLLRPVADEEEKILADSRAAGLAGPAARMRVVERYIDLLLCHRELVAYVMNDITGASTSRMVPRLQGHDKELMSLLAEADLPLADRVRTLSAIGVIMAVVTMPDVPAAELRPLVLDVVRDVLGIRDESE